jgi:bacterial/archaeal transporter family-2 protein
MSSALLVPVVLGVMAVAQVTLNGRVALHWGLAPAAVLNTLVALSVAIVFASWCAYRGPSIDLYRVNVDPSLLRWWWFLPGIFGFSLVAGMPWAVQKLGALATFVALIGAQMVGSVLWDSWVEGTALTLPRLLGAAFAVAGVALTSWK